METKIIKVQNIKYDGLFNFPDLVKVIKTWLVDNGYDPSEKSVSEQVLSTGKTSTLELGGEKKISDYIQYMIEFEIKIVDCVLVTVEKNGDKINSNKGKLEINMSCLFVTDFDNKWHEEPQKMFIKELFDKFVFKLEINTKEGAFKNEVISLTQYLKRYLNIIS